MIGTKLMKAFACATLFLIAIPGFVTAQDSVDGNREISMALTSSDHWELFPTQIRDKTAFVFYDEGISGRIDEADLPDLLKFKVQPPDGLPLDEEFETLHAVKGQLTPRIEQLGGLFVGRVTFDGHRNFHFFLPAGADPKQLLSKLAEETGYEMEFSVRPDPEKSGYWQDLYPDDDERQIITDLNLLQLLEKHGDNPETERQIEHMAFLPTGEAQESFRKWIDAEGYKLIGTNRIDEGKLRFSIEFTHVGRTLLNEVNVHTLAISRKARELGGDYDGWETTVERQ